MIDGIRYATLQDPDRFARLLVMFPVPDFDEPWGVLALLKETEWGEQIPVVTGEALSHALHGNPKMLRETWGNPPRVRAGKLAPEVRFCLEHQSRMCELRDTYCHPGSAQMPECYMAPFGDFSLRLRATVVGRAWAEDRHVFVVEGPEFIVT